MRVRELVMDQAWTGSTPGFRGLEMVPGFGRRGS